MESILFAIDLLGSSLHLGDVDREGDVVLLRFFVLESHIESESLSGSIVRAKGSEDLTTRLVKDDVVHLSSLEGDVELGLDDVTVVLDVLGDVEDKTLPERKAHHIFHWDSLVVLFAVHIDPNSLPTKPILSRFV